jgi:DNA-directed RNA polymerase specialized sigma24 family protein
LSYEDIGEILHVPAGTAKSRMHHALARLRTSIETEQNA